MNIKEFFSSEKVIKAKLKCIKPILFSKEMALFVTFTPDGALKPHVIYYLNSLKKHKISVILIIATDCKVVNLTPEIHQGMDGIFIRQNKGFDFAAWSHVFHLYPKIYEAQAVYLINDSMIGPTNDTLFTNLINRVRQSKADFIGLTDNFENYEFPWHLQSYFLVIKNSALSSQAFQNFFRQVKCYFKKQQVIINYETQFTVLLNSQGLHCEVMFPSKTTNNPTAFHWKALLQNGFPFLKMAVAKNLYPLIVDNRDWQLELKKHDYDCSSAFSPITEPKFKLSAKNNFSIGIYQIFYKKEQRYFLDKQFIAYDNSSSFAPTLCEYNVIKTIFDHSLHTHYHLVGTTSWKFRKKTGLKGKKFLNFIKANPGYDVYFINPFPQHLAYDNVWQQGDECHPNLKEITQNILTQIGFNIDLSSIKNDIKTTAYCNYWVGNSRFWEKYMAFTLPIYHYILHDSPSDLKKLILETCADKNNAPYFPFIFERLFSLLLATDSSIKSINFPNEELLKRSWF